MEQLRSYKSVITPSTDKPVDDNHPVLQSQYIRPQGLSETEEEAQTLAVYNTVFVDSEEIPCYYLDKKGNKIYL